MSADHVTREPLVDEVETVRVSDVIAVALRMHAAGSVQVCGTEPGAVEGDVR